MPPFVIIGFRKCKAKGTSLKTALFRSLKRGITPHTYSVCIKKLLFYAKIIARKL